MASLRKPNGDGVDYFEAEENDYGVINVITATGKTISLQVKGLDTISSIKLKIEALEDIPCRQQKLIFDEKLLQDNDILGNLCIEKESILKLLHCQDPLQCVSLKNQTAKMADKGKLGMADRDDRSGKGEEKASSHNVAFNVNYIYLLHQRHGMINIKTDTGKIVSLGVKGSDTVGSVKLKIQAKEHIPFDQQELIFNEVVLDNQYTLSSYSMKNQSTLTVTGKSVRMMKIKVKISTGTTISLTVYPTDTIADVKTKIYDAKGIPCEKQALMIDEKVLGDGGTLFDYYVAMGNTLTLMRQSRGFVIDILMPYDGETVTLKVKPSDTIRDVKAKLKGKTRGGPSVGLGVARATAQLFSGSVNFLFFFSIFILRTPLNNYEDTPKQLPKVKISEDEMKSTFSIDGNVSGRPAKKLFKMEKMKHNK
ncbi:putative Ubiquitin-like domain-containing protein [Helianthus annuus]|nr:putative Ubiquitin-like domain-containing protein [Helianthus annuus]